MLAKKTQLYISIKSREEKVEKKEKKAVTKKVVADEEE